MSIGMGNGELKSSKKRKTEGFDPWADTKITRATTHPNQLTSCLKNSRDFVEWGENNVVKEQ